MSAKDVRFSSDARDRIDSGDHRAIALLEGIADVEALVYRRLRELGAPTLKTVRTVGGGARNPAWSARKLSAPLLEPVSGEAAARSPCQGADQRVVAPPRIPDRRRRLAGPLLPARSNCPPE